MDDLLADTNILLRVVNVSDAEHVLVLDAVTALKAEGYRIRYAPQSLREFWSVATRPGRVNGLAYSIAETDRLASLIEAEFDLLPDSDAMHTLWRRLVVQREVKGVQVHDARLAASALVGGCRAVLTLNDADFKRFGVDALHPRDVPAFLGA